MKVVGKLYYYASGWTANTCVDIFETKGKYLIKLGPLNDLKQYADSIDGLKAKLALYYQKDKKFQFQKSELFRVTTSDESIEKNDQAAKHLRQKQQADFKSEQERDKQAAKQQQQDKQDISNTSDAIKNQRKKQAQKMAGVTGNVLQKAVKIYFIALLGFITNLMKALGASLAGALSTGKKSDIIMNKYFFAMVKDAFIVLPPLIILNMIFNPFGLIDDTPKKQEIVVRENAYEAGILDSGEFKVWKEECYTTQSGATKVIDLAGSKDEALAWCRATKSLSDIKFFIKQDIELEDAIKWTALNIDNNRIETFINMDFSADYVKEHNLAKVHPAHLYTFMKKHDKSLDEAVKFISLFETTYNYQKMLAIFRGDEDDLMEFVNETGLTSFQLYHSIANAKITNRQEIKAWNQLFQQHEKLRVFEQSRNFLLFTFKTTKALSKFNQQNNINLAENDKLINVLSPFWQLGLSQTDYSQLVTMIKKYNFFNSYDGKVNSLVTINTRFKVSFTDLDKLLSKGFTYIVDANSTKYMHEYIRKNGIQVIMKKLVAGEKPADIYTMIRK